MPQDLCGITWEVRYPSNAYILHLRVCLLDGSQKANQIFLPVLETAAKAQKLRTTLSVFERSKFFFNLPSFIMESIDAVSISGFKIERTYSSIYRENTNML